MEISRVGAAWLVLIGALIGALFALIATAPEPPLVDRDAGAPRSMVTRHCAPEAPWPCEPSR